MQGRYAYRNHNSELAAFAFVFMLIGGLMFIQFLLNIGVSAQELRSMYKLTETFSAVFPEAKNIFERAYLMAYTAYNLQQELSQHYSNKVLVLLAWARGEISFPVTHLVYGALSRYVFGYGVVYGLALKSAWMLLSLPLFIAGAAIWRNKKLSSLLTAYFKSKWMDPFGDRRIQVILRILMVNPVPASIYHHSPEKYGLLKHSYAVAKNAANRASAEGLDPADTFLAGLLHDIGKTKLYRYECIEEIPPDTDLKPGKKPSSVKKCQWVSLGTSQDVLNRIVMKEIEERFGVKPPDNREIWELVKRADAEETLRELESAEYDIQSVFLKAVSELNINNIFGTGKYDGWYSPDVDFVIVLAHALNRKVTETMLERDPGLPLSPEPGVDGVHTIAYVHPYKGLLMEEVNGKKMDKLGLFDVKVGKHVFNAVYLLKKEKLPKELLRKWGSIEFRIEVMERKK